MDLACVLLVRKSKAARASRRERAGGRRGEEGEGGGSGTFASAAATYNNTFQDISFRRQYHKEKGKIRLGRVKVE
jgi:hypothetical protein